MGREATIDWPARLSLQQQPTTSPPPPPPPPAPPPRHGAPIAPAGHGATRGRGGRP